MKKVQLYTGITLLILGLLGVASILTMTLPIPEDVLAILSEQFSDSEIQLLMLINPAIMTLIAVVIGSLLYKKVDLTVPIIESFFDNSIQPNYSSIIKNGIIGGIAASALIGVVTFIFNPYLPQEFIELGKKLQPSLPARFLYGGITEEILLRFGFMTLIVWIFKSISKKLNNITYWSAIIIASIVFALGHFPVAYNVLEEPSATLLTYILIGNSIGGLIFGWLYYKKGLESAFIAHIFTHICLVLGEQLIQ